MRVKWMLAAAMALGVMSLAGAARADDDHGRHRGWRERAWERRAYEDQRAWRERAWRQEQARRAWWCRYRGYCGDYAYEYYVPPPPPPPRYYAPGFNFELNLPR